MKLLSLMMSAAVMSSIMSNVATTAVLVTVVLSFLDIYDDETTKRIKIRGKRKLGILFPDRNDDVFGKCIVGKRSKPVACRGSV